MYCISTANESKCTGFRYKAGTLKVIFGNAVMVLRTQEVCIASSVPTFSLVCPLFVANICPSQHVAVRGIVGQVLPAHDDSDHRLREKNIKHIEQVWLVIFARKESSCKMISQVQVLGPVKIGTPEWKQF